MSSTVPRFPRFLELTPEDLNVEYQVHTCRTDGRATIEDLLREARRRDLSALAFTEHVRRETSWFGEFAAAVRRASVGYPDLRVYVGCEAKALDMCGSLDASEAVLEACDVVLGSVHRFPDGRGGYRDFNAMTAEACAEMECDLSVGLLRAAPIHVLAHPAGMSQRHFGAYPAPLFRRILEASLERRIAVEINASYLVDVDGFLALCREVNPYVSIGSDVHRLEEMGRCRDLLRLRDLCPR